MEECRIINAKTKVRTKCENLSKKKTKYENLVLCTPMARDIYGYNWWLKTNHHKTHPCLVKN